MKNFIVIVIYSIILLISEIIYRRTFDIPTLELKDLVENIFYTIILLSLFLFSKLHITRFIVFLFFCVSIIGNNIHYEIYKSLITGLNYYLFFKEFHEVTLAGNSLTHILYPHILWAIFDSVIFLSIYKFKTKKTFLADITFTLLLVFTSIKGINSNQESILSPKTSYSRIKQHYLAFGHLIGRIIPNEIFGISQISNYSHPKPNKISLPKIKNIIFIMGESATSKHMSFFGYKRKTTPFFEKISNISNPPIIKESYSAGVLTILSLPPLFNAIPYPNGHIQMNSGNTNFFRLAKDQNYRTYFYSSQAENQMGMMNLVGKRWIDDLIFPTHLGISTSQNMPDDHLLSLFYNIDLNNKENNLIVLHQRASHMPYGELLSEKDNIFGNKTLLDKYDNTIYKTDSFIQNIFEYLQKRNKDDWLLVYTSDHGQYVTETVNNQGTSDVDNYTVPLFIYTPNPVVYNTISNIFSSCEKATHQQIITSLISILGYDMPIANCNKSYINNSTLNGALGYLEVNQSGEIKHIKDK